MGQTLGEGLFDRRKTIQNSKLYLANYKGRIFGLDQSEKFHLNINDYLTSEYQKIMQGQHCILQPK